MLSHKIAIEEKKENQNERNLPVPGKSLSYIIPFEWRFELTRIVAFEIIRLKLMTDLKLSKLVSDFL